MFIISSLSNQMFSLNLIPNKLLRGKSKLSLTIGDGDGLGRGGGNGKWSEGGHTSIMKTEVVWFLYKDQHRPMG